MRMRSGAESVGWIDSDDGLENGLHAACARVTWEMLWLQGLDLYQVTCIVNMCNTGSRFQDDAATLRRRTV
jgi:hypothetical protein